mgnify:FL=1
MAFPKFQTKEVLNKVLNSGEDALNVDLSAGASAILVDDAAFTPATSSVQMVGAEFNDSTPDSVDEGDAGAVRMSGRREIYTQIRDSAGGEVGVQVVTDNATASATPNVLLTGAHYKDALDTYADNDAAPLHVDANGRLIIGGSTAHDAAVAGNPLLAGYEAKTLDGSALPNTVNAEGDIVRAASTLSGVAYNNLVVVDGSESAISEHDVAIGSGLGTAGVVNLYESKNQDGSALPNNVNAEGDMVRPAASLSGVQYIMPVSEDGSKTPMATDDSGQVATPEILNVGGEYRASATTYADGDATILQSDVIGGLKVGGSAVEDAAVAGNPVLSGGRYDTPGNDNASVRSLDNGDVGALALDPTGALYVREHLGQAGSCFVSGTAAVTAAYGKFVAIQFLEDTVFNNTDGLVATDVGRWPDDSGAASDVSSSNTAAVQAQVFPQGMTIFGRWDSFILVSGAVIAYVGNV